MNQIVEELIENALLGEIVPNVVERSIREVHHKPNNYSDGRVPLNPDLEYYANVHDKKENALDNARDVLNKVDKNREKNESGRFKTK